MNPLRHALPIAAANPHEGDAASSQTDSLPSPREAIFKALELEGCNPRLDNDGDIEFRHHDLLYLIRFNAKDPEYLQIVLPAFHAIGTDAAHAVAYEAANLTNATCKAAKVSIERGQTFAAIETFVATYHHVVPVLIRCANALEYAARSFAMAFSMIGRR